MFEQDFLNTLNQLKESTGRNTGIIQYDGNDIHCKNSDAPNSHDVLGFLDATADVCVYNGYTYKRNETYNGMSYYACCEGTDETAHGYCLIIGAYFAAEKICCDEKYDKTGFFKGIITNSVLPGEINIRAKELGIVSDIKRAVFIIRYADNRVSYLGDVLACLFPDREHDFVININENEITLIKEMKRKATNEECDVISSIICDNLNAEGLTKVYVGVSSVVSSLLDLSQAYNEACTALDIGTIFESERYIIKYNNLGIGRLINQLPLQLCSQFMNEVFKKGSIDGLDNDMMITINKLFENSLNVSEASRKLFVHRNTLVYRLDKIMKQTGLDLRQFNDAVIFKVAMMVNKYLQAKEISHKS